MTFYLHHVPGRLRIQTPRLQNSEEAARVACDNAMMIDGVCRARANPTIGSLLIIYDRQRLTPARLWEALCERGLVSGVQPIADEGGVTRITLPRTESTPDSDELLGAIARFAAEKLIEHFATALIGALI
jgi:Heavy metal associated domain 2